MSEQTNNSNFDFCFNRLKTVLMDNAYSLNSPQGVKYLPAAFLSDVDFMYELAQKVNGLIHPDITAASPVAQKVFEKIGSSVTGFKGKSTKNVESQIENYFNGNVAKSFLKTAISAEEKSLKQDPLNFVSHLDNKAILDLVFGDEDLKKVLFASPVVLALTFKNLSKEEQEKIRIASIKSGVLKDFVISTFAAMSQPAAALESILNRWNLSSLSSKVAEELYSAVTSWVRVDMMMPVLAKTLSVKHYTKSFSKKFLKTGIQNVGLSFLKDIPAEVVGDTVQEIFDTIVSLDLRLAEKVKESKILDLNQELNEEENQEAIDEAHEIVNKLDREFKNSYANLLMEVIASEFNGYNYTSISDEFGQIAQDETDYFEVVSLMLKKNAAHVLQEMCKTHQNSITRRLVAVAMNNIAGERIEGTADTKNILNICIDSITKAKDFARIDCYILSGFESFDGFTKAIQDIEKNWNLKHDKLKEELKEMTTWQKVQVLSRFALLESCGASYDPRVLLEEGLNVKGNRQVRNYLPNAINWALFELKEQAKELPWSALTTKKAVKINEKELAFYKIVSKYFQATHCKNFNPYSGFDVGAYEELCAAEKCSPYADSAKSKVLMYLTYLLGKNTAAAQALVKKMQNMYVAWGNAPMDLNADEKASLARLLTDSPEMWNMLHVFKKVIAKSGLDVSYKEFDKLSVMHYYAGVTDENYPIAYQLKKWKFDAYVFQDHKDLKPKKKSNIPLHEKTYNDKYLAHVLKPGDARALVMGEESGCCQSVDNAASECAEAAYAGENSSIFAIDAEDGKLISQSFIWLTRDGKHLIIDSIETIHQLTATSPYTKLIAQAYLDLAAEMNKKNIQVVMSASNYNNAGSRVYDCIKSMFPKELKANDRNDYYSRKDNEYVYSQDFDAKDNFDYSDLSSTVVNLSKLVKAKEKASSSKKTKSE